MKRPTSRTTCSHFGKRGPLVRYLLTDPRCTAIVQLRLTENSPATWGAACVVVDPWHALQTDTDPLKQVSDQADAPYLTALSTWGRIWLQRPFTVGERTIPGETPLTRPAK
jgi:hypothetical protein